MPSALRTSRILPFTLLILFLTVAVSSAGCLKLNQKSQTVTGMLGSITVTEVTYLWGEDGPFTHRYIVDMRLLGGSAHVEMSRREYQQILASLNVNPPAQS
jgi:hypothetical protein